MKIKYCLIIFLLVMISCQKKETKKVILLADREAQLGWVYLRIYEDSTFEFESRGLERVGTIYSGNVSLKKDTLHFNYIDSIPRAGNKAVIKDQYINYFGGKYQESLAVKKNELVVE